MTSAIHQCKQRKGHLQKHLRESASFVLAEQVADVLIRVPSSFSVVVAPSWWMLLETALNWQLKASPVRSSLKVAPRDLHFALRKFYGRSREATLHDPDDSANVVSGLHPPALPPLSGWNAGFASQDLGSQLSACFSLFSSSFREDQPWAFWLPAKSTYNQTVNTKWTRSRQYLLFSEPFRHSVFEIMHNFCVKLLDTKRRTVGSKMTKKYPSRHQYGASMQPKWRVIWILTISPAGGFVLWTRIVCTSLFLNSFHFEMLQLLTSDAILCRTEAVNIKTAWTESVPLFFIESAILISPWLRNWGAELMPFYSAPSCLNALATTCKIWCSENPSRHCGFIRVLSWSFSDLSNNSLTRNLW